MTLSTFPGSNDPEKYLASFSFAITRVMFLIANILEGKACKQQKLTLHNKKTYGILFFVELNPCKVSSLDFWSLRIGL